MEKINGRIISSGIGMGILKTLYRTVDIKNIATKRTNILDSKDVQAELDIFQKAADIIKNYYVSLCKKDEQAAEIFEALSQLATDEELVENVGGYIKEKLYTAEYAVYLSSRNLMKTLEVLDDDYIKQRARDVEEVADKIILKIIDIKDNVNIDNTKNIALNNDLSHILIVDKLIPEMLINDKQSKLKGVITMECPDNSHAAIIARIKNIPVIAGINVDELKANDYAIIDDRDGALIINPDEYTRSYYEKWLKDSEDAVKDLTKYKDIAAIAKNGKHIKVCANVSGLDDIKAAIENGADGIGLFRTEIVFMDRECAPTEEEQLLLYSEAAKLMKDKPLVIRAFDGGMDKPLKFMQSIDKVNSKEIIDERGISLLLRNKTIFKTQLRAIYRSAVYGNISVMFPMVSHIEELVKIQEILKDVKEELDTENKLYKNIKIGIMIETPSAVKESDILTKDIDFVSLGTNDLIHYAFEKDRTSGEETTLNDEEYSKILHMIKLTVENAHKNNCKVSICGELAGDLKSTDKIIEAGVDELSVAPSKILLLRKQIIS
jgi:phosphotransferase system enzyme I (PtsI)